MLSYADSNGGFDNVEAVFCPDRSTKWARPLVMASVSAGFPSPAEDYVEGRLDLNRHLIKHPAATFFVRVAGTSMERAGIHPGDLLVVDRSLEPRNGHIVLAAVDGEVTVKRLLVTRGRALLMPECDGGEPTELRKAQELAVWGVVTHVVHAFHQHHR